MLKTVITLVATVATLGSSAAQAEDVSNARYYANQTPYGDPATTKIRTAPAGYELFFLQTVARHGGRSNTNDDAEQRAMAVWTRASRRGAVTSIGRRFDDDLKAFQKAERSIGYGNLSAAGRTEWKGIGRRTADNYREFLEQAARTDEDIELRTTSIHRTKQSATALRGGLSAAVPGLDIKPRRTDDRMLIENGASKAGNAAIDHAERRSHIRAAARSVLRRLYSTTYVNGLTDPVAKALDIYQLYAIAPSMKGETNVTFSRYVPLADANRLASAKDAQNFYRYGPGVRGEARSYKQARPVLAELFSALDTRIAGGDDAAVFRLAHGETTMPFAALTRLPGSHLQAPRSATYSYGTNPWRGYVAGRMAGNIEWAAYRNADGRVLVTMRHNEQPVRLDARCTPAAEDTYFYTVPELKRCLR